MSAKPVIRSLQTGDITITSNNTSVTVAGNRISKLGAIAGHEAENPTIHIDLTVKQRQESPCVLATTEELGLIFSPADALEFGMLLVAMGVDGNTDTEAVLQRLSALIQETKTAQSL